LAKSYFKQNDVPRTSVDELDKIEKHRNQGKELSDWLVFRVYEPERQENGEIMWYLRKKPSLHLKNVIMTGDTRF